MMICICNALDDKQISAACAECPMQGAYDVFERLGRKPECGKCLCYIEDVMLPKFQQAPRNAL